MILVLLRHGQSEWNKSNIFTGWADVELSPEGEVEAKNAGLALKDYQFDAVFCSTLSRAQKTAEIALRPFMPPMFCSKALNERSYGELEGKNKDEMRKIYGSEQIHIWRRSYTEKPPGGESLKDCFDRVLPYYKKEIEPRLFRGQNILVCAHGNSLRALIKYLENISDEEITEIEIPTGAPIVYHLEREQIVEKLQL